MLPHRVLCTPSRGQRMATAQSPSPSPPRPRPATRWEKSRLLARPKPEPRAARCGAAYSTPMQEGRLRSHPVQEGGLRSSAGGTREPAPESGMQPGHPSHCVHSTRHWRREPGQAGKKKQRRAQGLEREKTLHCLPTVHRVHRKPPTTHR